MSRIKPIASLSLDIDNKWSYMKTHGDAGWESFPSYLDIFIPRVLDFLRERNLTISFFVVGQDAALDKNRDAFAELGASSHEIGNHSFHHQPWLHLYTEDEIESELTNAAHEIESATGRRPIGFRGPGYSLSEATLRVLSRMGYEYDASTFPTIIGPLARAFYFMTAKLEESEMEKRKVLFGKLSDGFRSLRPYRWRVDGRSIVELPVTTMPVFRIPMHPSYILYLANYSRALALTYFRSAMLMCRLRGVQPSLLLHPLDFLGRDDMEELAFFPAMNQPSERKLELMDAMLRIYADTFEVLTVREHSRRAAEGRELAFVDADSIAVA